MGNREMEFQKRVEEKIHEIEEKRAKEIGRYQRLNEKGRKRVEEQVKQEMEKEENKSSKKGNKFKESIIRAGALVAAGAIGVAGYNAYQNHKAEENEEKNKTEIVREDEDKATIEMQDEVEENLVLEQIVEKYNEKYPDSPISIEDVGIIKTEPQFLIEQTNEDGEIQYIQNYKIKADELPENQEVVYNEVGGYRTDGIYTVVNKNDKSIILSKGIINEHVMDIDTKIVKTGNNEYILNDKGISIEFESEAEETYFYIDLKNKFEEVQEQKLAKEEIQDDEMEI